MILDGFYQALNKDGAPHCGKMWLGKGGVNFAIKQGGAPNGGTTKNIVYITSCSHSSMCYLYIYMPQENDV
jgi:hypothetical protein